MPPFTLHPSSFALHQAPVYALAQCATENLLFTGGGDRIVALWDLESGNQRPFSVRTDAPIYSLFFYAPAQLLFVGCSNGKLHAIDIQSKQETHAWILDDKGVFDLKWDKEHNRLLAAGGSGILTALDLSELKVMRSVPLSDGKLRRVAIHRAGKLLAVADNSGPVHVLDADTYQTLDTIHAHADGATAVLWHPSKEVLLSGGKDAYIRCHSLTDRFKEVFSFAAHQSAIYDLVYHEQTNTVVSCSRDKTIKWWDTQTFDPLNRAGHAEGGHKHSVNRLLSVGPHLLSASDDRHVLVFGA
jgi:WD40 repeat protein